MNRRSGVLRRVIVLGLFVWAFSRFILNGGHIQWTPEAHSGLMWLLYASVVWGVVTLFANGASGKSIHREDNSDEHDGRGDAGGDTGT